MRGGSGECSSHHQRGTQKKVERVEGAPLFCTKEKNFDETFPLSSFFTPHFNLETCINASSPKARRGVSSLSLSLILLFYCYYCAWCKDIHIERDERASLEPTREKQKKRSRRVLIFLLKALCFRKISSLPRAERSER